MGLLLALAVSTGWSAEPVAVAVAEPLPPGLAAGARAALVWTSGSGPDRATRRVPGCFEVREIAARSGGANLAFVSNPVPAFPKDAVVRAALCRADGSSLVAPPPSVPADWVERLQAGDRVDVLVSVPSAVDPPKEAWTVTLLSDVPLVGSPVALSLGDEQLEPWFHAVDVGGVAVSLRTTLAPEPDIRHMATMVPLGMRFLALPLPEGTGPNRFVPVGYVDALVATAVADAEIVLQAVFVVPIGPDGRTTAALVTADQAEIWAHAAAFSQPGLVLRSNSDPEIIKGPVPGGTVLPPPDPTDCNDPPCDLVASKMRGLVAFTTAEVKVGSSVDVVVQRGSARDPAAVLTDRVVLAVRSTASGARIALLHVTLADALVATRARQGGELVTRVRSP